MKTPDKLIDKNAADAVGVVTYILAFTAWWIWNADIPLKIFTLAGFMNLRILLVLNEASIRYSWNELTARVNRLHGDILTEKKAQPEDAEKSINQMDIALNNLRWGSALYLEFCIIAVCFGMAYGISRLF